MHDGKMNPLVVLELSRRDPFDHHERQQATATAVSRTMHRLLVAVWRRLLRRPVPDGSGEVIANGHRRHFNPR